MIFSNVVRGDRGSRNAPDRWHPCDPPEAGAEGIGLGDQSLNFNSSHRAGVLNRKPADLPRQCLAQFGRLDGVTDDLVNRQAGRAEHRCQRIKVALEDCAVPLERPLARVEAMLTGAGGPAHLETGLDAFVNGLRGATSGLQWRDEVAQSGGIEAVAHYVERSKLLGNEKHLLSIGERRRNQVDDGLRLARAWWTLDSEVLLVCDIDEGRVLRCVRIHHDVWHLAGHLWIIGRICFCVSAVANPCRGQQTHDRLFFSDRALFWVEVVVHRDLRRWENPEADFAAHLPDPARRCRFFDSLEIVFDAAAFVLRQLKLFLVK